MDFAISAPGWGGVCLDEIKLDIDYVIFKCHVEKNPNTGTGKLSHLK